MPCRVAIAASIVIALATVPASAQTLEKKNYTYSE